MQPPPCLGFDLCAKLQTTRLVSLICKRISLGRLVLSSEHTMLALGSRAAVVRSTRSQSRPRTPISRNYASEGDGSGGPKSRWSSQGTGDASSNIRSERGGYSSRGERPQYDREGGNSRGPNSFSNSRYVIPSAAPILNPLLLRSQCSPRPPL